MGIAESLCDESITLKSCHGTYVVVESKNDINVSSKHRNSWETSFKVEILGGRKIALKTFEDLYVTADISGRLTAKGNSIGLWETFEFEIVLHSETEETAGSSTHEQEQIKENARKLICPICSFEYDDSPENEIKLDRHVNEHLEGLKCPVCFITFDETHQHDYETHVKSHFDPALDNFISIESRSGLKA